MIWDGIIGFGPDLLLGFILAGLTLNVTPGADFIFISASGVTGFPWIGMVAALGPNLGIVVHVLAAAAGVASGYFVGALRAHVGFLNKLTAILFGGLATRLIIN